MQPNTAKQNNHKFTKHYKIYAVVFAIFCFVLMVNKSIWAQIESIYNSSNDDIAGISSLMSAVSNNDIEGVKFFSKAGPIIINQKNLGGATALHIACRQANAEIVKILLENGASINIADNEGWTPLMRASLVANPEIVEMLIKKGAKADDFNSLGETAIVHATSSRCVQCLNTIIENGNLLKTANLKTLKTQITDAFLVARNQEEQTTKHILESFLDYVSKAEELANKSKESITAVDYIAESEPEEAPKKLSKKSKLKQDIADKPNNLEAKKISKTPVKAVNVPNKKFVLKNSEEANKKSQQKISQINQKLTDYSQNSEVKSTALPQATNIDINPTKSIENDTAQTQDATQDSIKTKTIT
jgi:ankyrin repeat protein